MDFHKNKKLDFDKKEILDTYNNSNEKYNSHLYAIQNQKCNLTSAKTNIFNLLKYLIILLLLNPSRTLLRIELEIKKKTAMSKILYFGNIDKPKEKNIVYKISTGSHSIDENLKILKFNCKASSNCKVNITWSSKQIGGNDYEDDDIVEVEEEDSTNDIFENNKDLNLTESQNLRMLGELKFIGDEMFKQCKTIIAIKFFTDSQISIFSMSHMFDSCSELVKIQDLYIESTKRLDYAFYNCAKLNTITYKLCSLSNTRINTSYMFAKCVSMSSTELNKFDFQGAKFVDMNSMYYNCLLLDSFEINSFDTS